MDERLRDLEARARRGDPDAARALVAARIRAQAQEGMWEQFDYLFDLIEQRPWDEALVASMEALCARMPANTLDELQTATERAVIADGQHSITPNHITRMVIRGGQFHQRSRYLSASNNETLANCRKVFICGGTFGDGALHGSEHVIISGGTFQGLGHVEGLTIINGTFFSITAQQNTLIIGGDIKVLSPGAGTVVIGGRIESIMWPTYATALIWLPTFELMQTGVPFNSRILAATLEIGRFARERWENDLRDSEGAVYVAACPPVQPPAGCVLPEILDLTFIVPRQYLYEQLPFLRKDNNINRTNIKAWLSAQFERLRQVGKPWTRQ